MLNLLFPLLFLLVLFGWNVPNIQGSEAINLHGNTYTLNIPLDHQNRDNKASISSSFSTLPKDILKSDQLPQLINQLKTHGTPNIQILTLSSLAPISQKWKKVLAKHGIPSEIHTLSHPFHRKTIQLAYNLACKHQGAKLSFCKNSSEPQLPKYKSSFYLDSKKSFNKWFKENVITPSPSDVSLGVVMGAIKFASAGTIWLSVGVHPAIASTLIVAQTAVTLALSTGIKTFDHLYSKQSSKPNKKASIFTELRRRQTFDLVYLELVRLISGPTADTHSVFTLLGQTEILSNFFAYGTGTSILSTVRNRKLTHLGSRWANFDNYVVASTLSMLDIAGFHFMTLASFGSFDLHLSTVLIFASTASLSALIAWKPEIFEAFAVRQQAWLDKAVDLYYLVKQKINTFKCEQMLSLQKLLAN